MPSLQAIAIGLTTLGAFFAAYNWLMVVLTWRTGRNHSPVGLVGGACMATGLLLLPNTRLWAWLGVVADPGTFGLVLAIPWLCKEAWSTSRFNLLEEYSGESGTKKVRIRFYRGGAFIMRQDYRTKPGELGPVCLSFVSAWRLENDRLAVTMNGQTALFERDAEGARATLRVVVDFPIVESALPYCHDHSLTGIELKRSEHKGA